METYLQGRRPDLGEEITPELDEKLQEQAQIVKDFLELLPTIRMTEDDAMWEMRFLARLVNHYGHPEIVGERLIELVGEKNRVPPHGDHDHWVIYREPRAKEREGQIILVSKIKDRSNRNPDRHQHPENCREYLLALKPGLQSVISDTKYGERSFDDVRVLTPYAVDPTKFHSDCNNAPEDTIYIVWRAVIEK